MLKEWDTSLMWKAKPTLTGKVTLWVTLLSAGLFLIFGFITFIVTLGNEDAIVHDILRNVNQDRMRMEGIVSEVTFDELLERGYKSATKEELATKVNSFGEFAKGEQYFHFMILEDKVLLMNSTNFVLSNEKLEDILILQLKAFFPFLLLAFFTSRLIAKRSLKPFSSLQNLFLKPGSQAADIRKLNQKIKETDIRQVADGLAAALEQKELVLEQQITFNQGVSHELRTPLQVMTHAAELIALKNPDLRKQNVYQRLSNSISRMHRMSESLLWLTSNVKSEHYVQVNLNLTRLRSDIEQLFVEHSLFINIVEYDQLSLPFPEAVFEFIVYNLANNVIHHAKIENNKKTLHVDIRENSLIFKNLVNENVQDSKSTQSNFGIGLSLIEKLTHRFNVKNTILHKNDQFIVELKYESL